MKFQLQYSDDFPKRFFISLAAIQILLVLIYVFTSIIFNRPSHTFNLDAEANIPAWFSTMQLFMIGIILLAENFRYNSMSSFTRKFIRLAGLGYIYLSMDEAGQVHETISNIIKYASWSLFLKGHSGSWAILYAAIGLLLIIWGRKAIADLYRIFTPEMKIALIGFLINILGCVVLEKLSSFIPRDGLHETLYKFEVVFEEYFEMLGDSLVLFGVMQALAKCRRLDQFGVNQPYNQGNKVAQNVA